MASGFFNRGKNNKYDDGSTYGLLLVGTSYTHDPDLDDLTATAIANNELSGTGYTRKTVTPSVTINDTSDQAEITWPDQTWSGADFGTVQGAILYREDSAADGSRVPMIYEELDSNATTNGGDYTQNTATHTIA